MRPQRSAVQALIVATFAPCGACYFWSEHKKQEASDAAKREGKESPRRIDEILRRAR